MNVAGRPILEWIVLNLVSSGIRHIVISVNYHGDQIEEHIGDGSRFGCEVTYLREEPDRPLGTAGSLSLFRQSVAETDRRLPIVVMNGDLMVQFSAEALLAAHDVSGAAVTVGVREYVHEVPYGVVEHSDDLRVTGCPEKPRWTSKINGGIYAVSWEALELVPECQASTMPDLMNECLERRWPVSAWPIESDWMDVGTPLELAKAKGLM
jgi:NDP-sugar pyrophosphorylase family protein